MTIRRIITAVVAALAVATLIVGPADAAKLITGKNIKNGSITKSDLAKSARATKPQVNSVRSQVITLPPGATSYDIVGAGNMKATCPSGQTVVGTAFDGCIGQTLDVSNYGNFVGAFFNNDTSIDYEVSVTAICAAGVSEGRVALDEANSRAARTDAARQAALKG
jgi:hypothetical protein